MDSRALRSYSRSAKGARGAPGSEWCIIGIPLNAIAAVAGLISPPVAILANTDGLGCADRPS